MKVNDKSTKGIFKYSEDLTYEAGDFVIQDNGLFVCLQESSGNKPSTSPEYYKPYLEDKCISIQEYLEEVENPDEGEDKYVSAATLSGILNYYMSGFSKKGEITNSIEILDSGTYDLKGDLVLENPLRTRNELLDYILNLETLNNGVFKISPGVFSESDGEIYPRILRQYTFRQGATRYRVQELINLNTGGVEYRVGDSSGIVSSWKSTSDHSELNSDVNKIGEYYRNLSNQKEQELVELKNCFRWKKAERTSQDQTSFDSLPLGQIYTAVISWTEDGKKRSQSVTSVVVGESGSPEIIYVTPNIFVKFEKTDGSGGLIEQTCTISVSGIGCRIECVYYSEYYK